MGFQNSSLGFILCESILQGGLWMVVSVSLCAAELQGGFHSVGSVTLHSTDPLGCLQTMLSVAQLPYVQRSFCDAFYLW